MSTEQALEDALEQSVINWIAQTATHSITLGITARQEYEDNADSITLPAVIVKAERSAEITPGAGVYQFRVRCSLLSQADDTLNATQRTQWHNLCSILLWSALDTELSTSTLKVVPNSLLHDAGAERLEVSRHWEQTFTFSCYAYAA